MIMTTVYFILVAIAVLALIFGAILGFASVKLKVEADPIVEKSMLYYHKANVVNVVIPVVNPMLKPLLMVMISLSVFPGANRNRQYCRINGS